MRDRKITVNEDGFIVKADLSVKHRHKKLLHPGFLVSPQERKEFPLDISKQSRPILKTAYGFRHPDRTLLNHLPSNGVQVGEKARQLLCQAILCQRLCNFGSSNFLVKPT